VSATFMAELNALQNGFGHLMMWMFSLVNVLWMDETNWLQVSTTK
jgi:hypothetical protein